MNAAIPEKPLDPGRTRRLLKRVLSTPNEAFNHLREAGHLPVLLRLP